MATSTITSVGTVADSPGLAQGSHLFYAVNTGLWWCFQFRSASNTTLYARYTSDITGLTGWADPTNNTFTLAHSNAGNGRCLGVAYANIASVDAVHIAIYYSGTASTDQQSHIRATLSGTTITWGSEVAEGNAGSALGATPSVMTVVASDGTIFDSDSEDAPGSNSGDYATRKATNKELGSSWSTGFPTSGTLLFSSTNIALSSAYIPLATGGKVISLGDNGSTTGTPNDVVYSLWGGASWSPATATSVFGSTAAININDWGACRRTDTDVHAVRRIGASTYLHRRWNGTSWGAGDSIGGHTSKASAGMAMVSDGLRVYLFYIDSVSGNSVRYLMWAPVSGWSTPFDVDATSQVRTNITAYYSDVTKSIAVSWTQTNGANFDLMVAPLAVGITLFLHTTTASGTTPASVLQTWGEVNSAATGANAKAMDTTIGTSQVSTAYTMLATDKACVAMWIGPSMDTQTLPIQTYNIGTGLKSSNFLAISATAALSVMKPDGTLRGTVVATVDLTSSTGTIEGSALDNSTLTSTGTLAVTLGDKLVLELGFDGSSGDTNTLYYDGTGIPVLVSGIAASDVAAFLQSPYVILFKNPSTFTWQQLTNPGEYPAAYHQASEVIGY